MKCKILLSIEVINKCYWFIVNENNQYFLIYPTFPHSYFLEFHNFPYLTSINKTVPFKGDLGISIDLIITLKNVNVVENSKTNLSLFSDDKVEEIKNHDSYKEFIDKYY